MCLIGDSGTGKSHLLIALATATAAAAAEAGFRVKYTLATDTGPLSPSRPLSLSTLEATTSRPGQPPDGG